ncbi:hypothetical protein MMA86_25235, partial [Salmonella enterica]|nr:hypothetical protein [Salmonella enterica]
MKYNHHIRLIDGAKIKNFKIGTHEELDQVMTGVWKAVAEENSGDIVDIQVCSNGTDWFSLRGYKAQNTYEGTEKIIPV